MKPQSHPAIANSTPTVNGYEATGFSFWGYGGNTCHPTTKVKPFVEQHTVNGRRVHLCMQKMTSRHFAVPAPAKEYSHDGETWKPVPKGINVLGSRFALVLRSLVPVDFALDLADTRVGVGLQLGRSGAEYIQGRVDKACLELLAKPELAMPSRPMKIELAAELAEPFAVLLR